MKPFVLVVLPADCDCSRVFCCPFLCFPLLPLILLVSYGIVMANAAALDAAIIHSRDNGFDYFGFKTLERS
jgi:hypothetical protein